MALSETGQRRRITESRPGITGRNDRGIRNGAPFSFWPVPTLTLVPTLPARWGQEKPFDINCVPTGPTWTTNFFPFLIRRMCPLRFRSSSCVEKKKVGTSGTSGDSVDFERIFLSPLSTEVGTGGTRRRNGLNGAFFLIERPSRDSILPTKAEGPLEVVSLHNAHTRTDPDRRAARMPQRRQDDPCPRSGNHHRLGHPWH